MGHAPSEGTSNGLQRKFGGDYRTLARFPDSRSANWELSHVNCWELWLSSASATLKGLTETTWAGCFPVDEATAFRAWFSDTCGELSRYGDLNA